MAHVPGKVLLQALDSTGIARVVLQHPGRLNAMTRAMWCELRSVFESVQRNADARCVVMEGEGAAFCAGGDISEYPAFRFDAAQLRAFHEDEVWGGLSAMLECDVPIVAVIRGACMGAGVEIASCCDIRIAQDDARFGAPIAKLGFPMAPREAALVASRVGDATARQMLLEAAMLDAQQMAQRGFLACVVPAESVARQAQETALRIARLAPQAARLNKRTLRGVYQSNTAFAQIGYAQAATDFEPNDPYAYANNREHREGVETFLAKRKPEF